MNKKIVAQNGTVLIGVDVHTASHVVTVKVVGQEGMAGTCTLSPNREAWRSFLKRLPGCDTNPPSNVKKRSNGKRRVSESFLLKRRPP